MPLPRLCLALLLGLHAAHAWSAAARPALTAQRARMGACSSALMMAKGKKSSRKGKRKPAAAKPYQPVTSERVAPTAGEGGSQPVASPSSGVDADLPVEERVAQVLRSAGISDSDGSEYAKPKPTDPLSRIPKKGQDLLERFFAGGALTFGSIFLISGISVSVEALCKVLGSPLPVAVDEALVQYVEPALTPSILILFFFSISLGLLKQLQLGSESAGVLYIEEDDD